MGESLPKRNPPQGLLGRITGQFESRLAPYVAPYLPERYYEIYRRTLADAAEKVPVLDGLAEATVESGHVPLLLSAPDTPDNTQTIWAALARAPRLLILGCVGSGKSTLLRSLAWEFSRRPDKAFIAALTFKLFGRAVEELVPVWLDLGAYNRGSLSLIEALLDSMARHGFPAAGKFLRERMQAGQCLVLLDGFDQVRDVSKQSQVAEVVAAHPQTIWLVTSRPCGAGAALVDFSVLDLRGVARADVSGYLEHNLGPHSVGRAEILAACERSESLAELARVPLMLAAMCRAFRTKTATAGRLPLLCSACLETLADGWGARNGSRTRFSREEKLRVLAHIAWEMQRQEKRSLEREQILAVMSDPCSGVESSVAEALCEELTWGTGVLCSTEDGQAYRFVAPILQSYLAAHWAISTEQTAVLLPLVELPWWRDTVVLAASLLADPLAFVRGVQMQTRAQPYRWFLLASCIAELVECDEALRQEVSDQLLALLEGDVAEHWQPAAIAIAGMVRKQVKEHFTALIRHPESQLRQRAALALGRLGQEWAIPSLGGAVSGDAEPEVRQRAVWALGHIPSPQAVPVLSRALRSPYGRVREAAAHALATLGQIQGPGEAAVRELVSALGDESAESAQLVERALLQVGRAAMPQLMLALNDRRVRQVQRSRVAKALGRLGDEHALPVLIEAILSGTSGDLQDYVEAVAAVGESAVAPLIKALGGKDVTTGAGLVAALVKIGAPAVQPLIESIAGMSPEVRNAAVRALEQIGSPAVEPLIHALLHDERYEVRRRALEVLGHISGNHVAPALIQALEDADAGVRLNAVRYLGNFGDASAVAPLVNILRTDENLAMRRTAIDSLSAIGDPAVIAPLLDALEDAPLCEAAALALPRLGQAVVEPLVEKLHAPPTSAETREAIWGVLERVGATARPEEETPYGLASTYARLRNTAQSPEEILALTERLSWWPRGVEVHRSLATAQTLAAVKDLESISGCGTYLDWLSGVQEWFRPQMRSILWGFKDIVENIRLYRTLTRRDAQRDALLSSIDRLADLQDLTQRTVLPVEQVFLERAIDTWRAAILDGIKQLRGRASLLIELLTPRLPMRAGQVRTVAAFNLFNQGDSAARNFSVTVRPAALHGIEIVDGEDKKLEPLGIGEARQVDINIVPRGLREADLTFEAHYDDDEREGVTQPFSCRIGFQDAPSVYTPIASSPYVAGLPIRTPEMFFGRQDIFAWVRDNVSSTHQENALLLYGERRMGKTSVLYQLQLKPPTPNHTFLLFDLQLYSYINTIPELLYEMALAIMMRLGQEGFNLEEPDLAQFEVNPHRAFRAFCATLDSALGDHRVVVMLDEFGVLMLKVRNHVFDVSIFDFLRGIIQSSRTINFLFTGAYEVRRMQEDYDSILFNMVRVRKISYLEPGEATELIEKPMTGLLAYHPLVVQRIRTVTACHPYFVQYICEELVQLARSERRNYVELSDLDLVVKNVVHDATGNIEKSIYNYLGNGEKLTLAALANATDDVRVFVTMADVAGVLERRSLGMPREALQQAFKALEERDLITEMRIGQQLRYSFRMGLVRMWLRQNEILLRLSQE